jgi:hypothetical protein
MEQLAGSGQILGTFANFQATCPHEAPALGSPGSVAGGVLEDGTVRVDLTFEGSQSSYSRDCVCPTP